MTSQKKNRERRGRPSHRDDLRGQLIAAACTFVAREGHEGLSMRRLAEEVGVSSAAPYHHFPDRRALLIEVALEGYRTMFAGTEQESVSPTEPRARLFQTLRHFIRFAVQNPHMFTLMYESELVRPNLAPEIQEAHESGFQRLDAEVGAPLSGLSDRDRSIRISTMWSATFGFALQSNRAMIRTPSHEPAPDELADEIVRLAIKLIDLK
ncbi:TetR/AcrR family transcriptional regulator [Niveispirillum irakense]|uniref:TetR/AcrR family transcriptional regulator n=1 Tax=Niveispirillum irakense TaxID=34011 RepID=UPI00048E9B00|nr:TetR/AcrR family transcriptional regulator [Niveispirillum irakense]